MTNNWKMKAKVSFFKQYANMTYENNNVKICDTNSAFPRVIDTLTSIETNYKSERGIIIKKKKTRYTDILCIQWVGHCSRWKVWKVGYKEQF